MLCPSCGKENGGRFGDLCPACQAWIKTRRLPDSMEAKKASGPTGVILSFVAHSTHRLRGAWKFFDSLHWGVK